MPIYDGPIIDVDVHHRWVSTAELLEFVSPQWRELIVHEGGALPIDAPAVPMFHHVGGSQKRRDSYPQLGPPGSDYKLLCEQWLDPFPVELAVLTFDIGTSAGLPNPYLATALCRAANDWTIERWLDRADGRIAGAVLVPTQLPEDGADEIRRVGGDERFVEALLVSNGLGEPFGHPAYHPIYAAAAEVGLPVAIHLGGDSWTHTSHMSAGGMPSSRFEYHTVANQSAMLHLASFVTHGVFELFPTLKLLLVETGVTWVPWLFWRLDEQYALLRRESPIVRRLPSEYLREHVKLSTQPLEDPPRHAQLIQLFEAFGGMEELLCFSSDYPHWDADDPRYIARILPADWAAKVFYANAASVLRLPARHSRVPLAAGGRR
ncbi:MAG: amidohydrolase [Solirubrobacterales bacterium]|nr:amidohydrolase [Solirubrobacterales bacterium]